MRVVNVESGVYGGFASTFGQAAPAFGLLLLNRASLAQATTKRPRETTVVPGGGGFRLSPRAASGGARPSIWVSVDDNGPRPGLRAQDTRRSRPDTSPRIYLGAYFVGTSRRTPVESLMVMNFHVWSLNPNGQP